MSGDNQFVYVIDWRASAIVALRVADGTVAWTAGKKGDGPGEFIRPQYISVTPNGEIAVLDDVRRRMSFFRTDGSFARDFSLAAVLGNPESFCPLADGGFLVAVTGRDSLLRVSSNGELRGALVKPWKGTDDRIGVVSQVLLIGDQQGKACAAMLARGLGFGLVRSPAAIVPFVYVEPLALPTLVRSAAGRDSLTSDVIATWFGGIQRDTLWILFDGATAQRRRLLDAYDARTGAYLTTRLLPWQSTIFAIIGHLIVAQPRDSDGTVSIVALREQGVASVSR